ncbi:MAG: helix-turn-helix transcriptional regulator [Clostridiales bacterium]|nr:helix-turn-helix transcriptional regulator [Clostridiales bacterium]
MNFCDFIKEARLRNHITQQALAHTLGVSRTAVSNWESGRRTPDVKRIIDLFAALNITEKDIESTEHISLNQNLVDFNLSCLNAKGLSRLYDFYFDLIQDEENIK